MRLLAICMLGLTIALEASSRGPRTNAPEIVAAPGIIEGVIKDRVGSPVPGVSVATLPERGGQVTRTTTGLDGTYQLDGLMEDTHRVDFALPGFEGTRHNHVRVRPEQRARVDSVLSVRPLCECVGTGLPTIQSKVAGQVVDDAGRPLPHARLKIVSPTRQQISKATIEPLVLRLRFIGTQGLSDTEMFNYGCSCPEYFAHEER